MCIRASATRPTRCWSNRREQGKKFIEAPRLFSHLANVGDCRSLVIHPASTTHFRMSDEALAGAGITQGTIRLSIGLEDPADLIDDLKRALRAARLSTPPSPRSSSSTAC
jgi:O-acetylhomoserine/O-acetylserine sulfhydrylase-like pyridoxal-dependent enzyme